MIFDIQNVGFVNKGAELMLHAIIKEVSDMYENPILTMKPSKNNSYLKRAQMGLYQTLNNDSRKMAFINSIVGMSQEWRERYGIVINSDIDVVLDAAGFAYGDQFGIRKVKKLAKCSIQCKKFGSKLILLPQAFGPFSSALICNEMNTVIKNADLIFARDQLSYDYLINISGENSKIKIAPDFTNLVSGIVPDSFVYKGYVCIIPNYKMMEKTNRNVASRYVAFLTDCVRYIKSRKCEVFILIHEGVKDVEIAKQISFSVGDIPIIFEECPLKIKGIIGQCKAVISGRFHGLISALSQGVPALATGWSHKYKMLFDDYKYLDGLIDVLGAEQQRHSTLDNIIDEKKNKELRDQLIERSKVLKHASIKMWKEVFYVIDN
jgi:polysaccharide pyruvyl transferase WcaK-like protein